MIIIAIFQEERLILSKDTKLNENFPLICINYLELIAAKELSKEVNLHLKVTW